jgi:purine-binding chemotaxis protein CheW
VIAQARTTTIGQMIASADELRAAFDRGFAQPIAAPIPEVDVIAIRAGGGPCAFLQATIAAIDTSLHVVPVPTPSAALRGVATFRGQIVSVWDLGLLVHGAPVTPLRWCAVLGNEMLAVAFDRLEGRVRVPAPAGSIIELSGTIYPIIDLAGTIAGVEGARHGR